MDGKSAPVKDVFRECEARTRQCVGGRRSPGGGRQGWYKNWKEAMKGEDSEGIDEMKRGGERKPWAKRNEEGRWHGARWCWRGTVKGIKMN